MKINIFTLMLSTVIFTTSPLFAMEVEDTERPGAKSIPLALSSEEIISSLEETHFKGIPTDTLFCIFQNLSPLELEKTSLVSKAMYSFCQSSECWSRWTSLLSDNSLLDKKTQIFNYWKALGDWDPKYCAEFNSLCFDFNHLNKEHRVSMKMFKYFIKDGSDNSGYTFNFNINGKDYRTENVESQGSDLGFFWADHEQDVWGPPLPEKINLLNDSDEVVFYGYPATEGVLNESYEDNHFRAQFYIVTNGQYTKVIDCYEGFDNNVVKSQWGNPDPVLKEKDQCIKIFQEEFKAKFPDSIFPPPQAIPIMFQIFDGED